MSQTLSLTIAELRDRYRNGRDTPAGVIARLFENGTSGDSHNVWITRLPLADVMIYVDALAPFAPDQKPLYGIPFVIKDNIDLAGVPTTAACPRYAYTPQYSASVVQRLIDAGAIPLGKVNLDQFATGLVGTRTPFGACHNSFNSDYIAGGSSAGSAVAVAMGLASFALGTDTAGSGRVPAAFNNVIGLKPTLGRLSTHGVIPACRSLDCVSIFALMADDAAIVFDVTEGFEAGDPFSRRVTDRGLAGLRVGVPQADQLQFFGDAEYRRLFDQAINRMLILGGTRVEVDFGPFLEAARLLYEGPWIAERYAAVGAFIETNPDALHPITKMIIESGKSTTAVAAFRGDYRLRELKRQSEAAWAQADLLCTPTAGTIYSRKEVEADPIRLNANLGYYTNFMNLFDLAGVAVPAGFRADGLPFGITLIGPCGTDRALLQFAARLHRASVTTLGATTHTLPSPEPVTLAPHLLHTVSSTPQFSVIAVCGAHMDGLPLNHQLRERGGYWVQTLSTARAYRLFSLPGGPPHRPGLVRVSLRGERIELEIWAVPTAHLGSFITGIPRPLGIGQIELETGDWVSGFICEAYAVEGATDISCHGGWRAYLASMVPQDSMQPDEPAQPHASLKG